MKRLLTILALMLALFAFAWGAAFSADIEDPDDHTWGGEQSGEPGQYRHTNCGSEITASGVFAIDIMVYQTISYDKLRSLFDRSRRADDLYQRTDDGVVYNNRARQVSVK
ncbi:MAG: hypothetical protein AB1483_06300 [Candidatus Zixiibacteriota bacterium]